MHVHGTTTVYTTSMTRTLYLKEASHMAWLWAPGHLRQEGRTDERHDKLCKLSKTSVRNATANCTLVAHPLICAHSH